MPNMTTFNLESVFVVVSIQFLDQSAIVKVWALHRLQTNASCVPSLAACIGANMQEPCTLNYARLLWRHSTCKLCKALPC